MQSTSTIGYPSSYILRDDAPYVDPLPLRQGYTQPYLTTAQHAAVILGASLISALVSRPVSKLERFYFLSDVPGESNRIFMSDKRAQFFRVLFDTNWLRGRSLLWGTADHAFSLALFVTLRDRLNARSAAKNLGSSVSVTSHERAPSVCSSSSVWARDGSVENGFIAGAAAGVIYAAVRHPYDVLRATAEARGSGPKRFHGPMDVFTTALIERPAILSGLTKGLTAAAISRGMQFSAQFGIYSAVRCDGVYRGPIVLYLYCHLAAFAGLVLHYPFLAVRQQLRMANMINRGRSLTYRALFMELRRRHGITKVYDGFFSSRPWLTAFAPALAMFLYDVWSRRYTEFLHPERRARARPAQSLTNRPAAQHVQEPEPYEFKRGA